MARVSGTGGTDRGNTITRSRAYIYTLNNPSELEISLLEKFDTEAQKYGRQEEVGASGNYHIQGCWSFKHPRRFTAIKKKLPRIHLEKMKGTWEQAHGYATDPKKRKPNGKVWSSEVILVDPMDGKEWYEWQIDLMEILRDKPDDRTIIWLWDREGCCGKTTLAKHICMNYKGAYYLQGKGNDIKYGVAQMKEPRILIFDYTRSLESFVSWEAIESVKNGIFFCGKYESTMKIYNPPHVVCFANFKPDETKLSVDRWLIQKVDRTI